jgi:oxygen-independent coproporphyrinogen-3 oxidase
MSTEATKTEVGSYFISNYPPYSQWTPEAIPEALSALATLPGSVSNPEPSNPELPPLGLYLHIPFCR